MKLEAFKRTGKHKSEVTTLRHQGDIPAVIYGPKKQSEGIFVKGPEFHAALRKIPSDHLSNTVFDLTIGKETHKAVVKDIQYHRTTYKVLHLDFQIIEKAIPVKVNVPIRCLNVAECQGVKLGGTLRRVIRNLKIECLFNEIPHEFTVDVKNMNIGDSVRLSDIELPKNVRPLLNMQEVAVAIAKR